MPANRPGPSPAGAMLRALLLTRIPFTMTRPIDIVILPVGMAIAVVVCIPILVATVLAGVAVGLGLQGIGAPDAVSGLPGLIGFVGGLVIGFLVLLRLYRRLPAAIRSWVIPEDVPGADTGPLPFGRDPAADAATLSVRIATADATLAADDAPRADRPE